MHPGKPCHNHDHDHDHDEARYHHPAFDNHNFHAFCAVFSLQSLRICLCERL